jgi:hypothetical protein
VDRLHRGDDVEGGQPREVLPVEHLHMLDAVSRTQRPRGLPVSLVGIQHPAIRAVADGVDGTPESRGHRAADELDQLLP